MKLRSRRTEREPRLMIIPMIDIIFFLLVFFMMNTLFMVQQNVLPVQLPTAKSAETQPAKQVAITVSKDGNIWINSRQIKLQDFRTLIQEEIQSEPHAVFVLRADRVVPHGQVIEVMDEMKIAGVKRISVATEGGQ